MVCDTGCVDDGYLDEDDFDLDNLPPDLQALLNRGEEPSPRKADQATFSPSDIQSPLGGSQGTAYTVDCCGDESRAGAESPGRAECRLDFVALLSSSAQAVTLANTLHRSLRKIEHEAPLVEKAIRCGSTSPSLSLSRSLNSTGRLAAMVARASPFATSVGSAASSTSDTTCEARLRSVQGDGDDEIEALIRATIVEDKAERLLPQPRDATEGASAAPQRQSKIDDGSTLEESAPRGLMNLGNTCFINAAVQVLAHCAPLSMYMLQGYFVADLNEGNPLGTGCVVALVFAALLHELFALRRCAAEALRALVVPSPFPPLDFLVSVARFHPFLASGEMHDAQELLGWLLDALHEDLNRAEGDASAEIVGRRLFNAGELAFGDVLERHAAESWGAHLRSNRSVVVDLFQGQLKSQLRCPCCGSASVGFDPFLHLTLPLPARCDRVSIEDAILQFCREEALDNENAWDCPNCNQRVMATKKLDLWKLPQILMVHLKRFEWVQGRSGRFHACKLNCMVDLPKEGLLLDALVAPGAPQKTRLVYDLVGVIDHLGTSVEAGHYRAACLRPGTGWYRFDDSQVTSLSDAASIVGRENYVLLLARRGASSEPAQIQEQRRSRPQLWPHVVDMSWPFLALPQE